MLNQLEYITSLDLLRDIIQQELSLKDSQIFMYGQPFILPTYDGLFVNMEFKYSKVYSSRNLNTPTVSALTQEQNVNTQEFLTVQLFSRNWEAYRRKEEAGMALKSFYAQQLQEKYSFKLSVNPNILDLTGLESSAMLYRYDVPVVLLTAYQKIKPVQWFDTFNVAVDVNDGNPDIEVEFTQPVNSLPT